MSNPNYRSPYTSPTPQPRQAAPIQRSQSGVNIPVLIAMAAAIIVYFVTPIIQIAYVIGIRGQLCMNMLGFWFVLPVLAMGIALVLGLFIDKRLSSIIAIVATLTTIITFLIAPSAAGSAGTKLFTLLGASADSAASGLNASALTMGAAAIVQPGWGLYAVIAIGLTGGILGLLINNSSSGGRHNHQSGRRETYGTGSNSRLSSHHR